MYDMSRRSWLIGFALVSMLVVGAGALAGTAAGGRAEVVEKPALPESPEVAIPDRVPVAGPDGQIAGYIDKADLLPEVTAEGRLVENRPLSVEDESGRPVGTFGPGGFVPIGEPQPTVQKSVERLPDGSILIEVDTSGAP